MSFIQKFYSFTQKFSSFIIAIAFLWFIGIISFFIGFLVVLKFAEVSNLSQPYYSFNNLISVGSIQITKIIAQYNLILIFIGVIFSAVIFLGIMFGLFRIKKLEKHLNYFSENEVLISETLTLSIVIFGFIPLFLAIIKFNDDAILKEFNSLLLFIATGFIIAYISIVTEKIYLLIQETR